MRLKEMLPWTKSRELPDTYAGNHFSGDVWGYWAEKLKDKIPCGYSVFAEIVGYTSTGSPIQIGYSYGCEPFESRLVVYRVTHTSADGYVLELPWPAMRDWCHAMSLTPVKELYYGHAEGLVPKLSDESLDEWRTAFLKYIQDTWSHDRPCPHNPLVPFEGVVVRIDHGTTCSAFKEKTLAFRERETKLLDTDTPDIEEGGDAS